MITGMLLTPEDIAILKDIRDKLNMLLIGVSPAPTKVVYSSARRGFNRMAVAASTAPARKLSPSKLKAKERSNAARNKKCATCKAAFFDDSRTATRKWCGLHGCRRDSGGISSNDLPGAGGRKLPLGEGGKPIDN